MLFKKREPVTEFVPTFLKEDRSALRKIHEMISGAQNHIYIVYPWITLGEEFIIPFENALSNNKDVEVYLITKLEKEDVFRRLHQLDDVERWKSIFGDNISIKYNNNLHAKMIIVDDTEMIAGSSNLTGSGLGSSRDYEGKPQIEANIYTNDRKAVENGVGFFVRLWSHKTSNKYADNEYVLSCKSYHLSGIYQRYRKDFDKIVNQEKMRVKDDGTLKFNGILGYLDSKKAYVLGKTRKDIAVKLLRDSRSLNSSKIGDEVEISGKFNRIEGHSEFIIKELSKGTDEFNINNLRLGLSKIRINGEVVSIEEVIEMETKYGSKVLTLVKIKDNTGDITLELWDNIIPSGKLKCGIKLEITNGYTKVHEGELRLGLQKNDGKIKLLGV
ncbi:MULTISPECIES: phospholipase D-like domain-containing protein [Methanobacterium]|uniref:Phospholipase D-like domain-containing protein n=1 Tax=Methanobacterium veterum TaxID=408577 RepID=A0A9E4ZZP9_9EURY|nr:MULTISPECIES: phospholipase D-like domain-containing protein [Methanobacterium]MCZ3366933.1 phospholipase D-like domain-containing protein [Methanobacterium veterum]MCZ3373920.1 phospholipase D-like domain-containing protein [Methanobacterium veterum]